MRSLRAIKLSLFALAGVILAFSSALASDADSDSLGGFEEAADLEDLFQGPTPDRHPIDDDDADLASDQPLDISVSTNAPGSIVEPAEIVTSAPMDNVDIAEGGTQENQGQSSELGDNLANSDELFPLLPLEPIVPDNVRSNLVILNGEVEPGTMARLSWRAGVSFDGVETPTPVFVLHGKREGATVCLTAAVHGDEVNGIEIVRRVVHQIDPNKLFGTVIAVPIVNIAGFQRNSRYLPDRRDLNRYFPGRPTGSLASRVAYSFFNNVIKQCSILVDIHTASFYRTNLPQIRADMTNERVAALTESFDKMVVVHNTGGKSTLRGAAVRFGIPTVTLELGGPSSVQEEDINAGVEAIMIMLDAQGVYKKAFTFGEPSPVYIKSHWVRVGKGGLLFSKVLLGDLVTRGQLLGKVADPITNEEIEVRSPYTGRVIGMAVNQVVMEGYAAYHIGIRDTEKNLVKSAEVEPDPVQVEQDEEQTTE